jgi:hypothetical protein
MEQESLEIERQRRLSAARRVVVKLGTNTVTAEGGEFCNQRVEPIVRSISNLLQSGRQVVWSHREPSDSELLSLD